MKEAWTIWNIQAVSNDVVLEWPEHKTERINVTAEPSAQEFDSVYVQFVLQHWENIRSLRKYIRIHKLTKICTVLWIFDTKISWIC